MLRIPARGTAAAPKGERQRGSSQHWKGRIVLVNSRLITLLDSTANTGSWCGGLAGRSLRGTEREMYRDVQRDSERERFTERERERGRDIHLQRKREIYRARARESRVAVRRAGAERAWLAADIFFFSITLEPRVE